MRLCEEYVSRKGLAPYAYKRAEKCFLLYKDQRSVLVIKWTSPGPHPGDYEFSECSLEKVPRVLNSERVSWEDYEPFIRDRILPRDIVSGRQEVFRRSWEFFLRRNDDFLAANFDPVEVRKTLDDVVLAMSFLDKVGLVSPKVRDFWWTKAGEMANKYAFWICDLASASRKG